MLTQLEQPMSGREQYDYLLVLCSQMGTHRVARIWLLECAAEFRRSGFLICSRSIHELYRYIGLSWRDAFKVDGCLPS
jgi:hypothetical protein